MAPENPDPKTGEVSLFDADFARCPQPVYRRMHAQCPVTRAAFTNSPVISKYEDVLWALRHPELFSSEMEMQMALGTERPMIPQQVDPPAQTRYRKFLDPRFSRKRMLQLEPRIRADADALIDRFHQRGECDFNREFAVPLPCNAFLHLMGLPTEDLELFLGLKDGIIRPQPPAGDPEAAQRIRKESGKQIYQYFERVIDDRRAHPRDDDDMMTYLVSAELDGRALSGEEILDICFLMLLAGLDTVTATLGCSVAYLAQNPEQRKRFIADASLVDSTVEELLRWETPVTAVPRICKRDHEVGGLQIKAGEMVTLLIGAANLDDDEFGNADEVDLARERNRHLAFGGGPHRCLGSHLARMELRVALDALHRRIPDYRIKPGEVPTYTPGIREVRHLPLVWETR